MGYDGQSKLKLSGQGRSKLKLRWNGKECRPMVAGTPKRPPARVDIRATAPADVFRPEAGAYTRPLFSST